MAAHSRFEDETIAGELTQDTVFSVLSNQRRRQVLRFLRSAPEGSDVRELSQQVAAWENDVAVEEVTYKQRKRVYTSLHQTHLPALADAGVVDYDRDRGTVVLTPQAATLDDYLATSDGPSIPWHRLYLGIAAVGTVATLLIVLDVLPTVVSGVALAGAVSLAVAAVAGVHGYLVEGRSRGWHLGDDS